MAEEVIIADNNPDMGRLNLSSLPIEILSLIIGCLPNRDIKSLRLTSKLLCDVYHLRIERVFISANPLNLEVFAAIAAHEYYRHQVLEIVWDDALLEYYEPHWNDDTERYSDAPPRFIKACHENTATVKHWDQECPKRIYSRYVASEMPVKVCYDIYMELFRQQESILATEQDIEMFRLGLAAFPNLKSITITPVAHGQFLTPRYPTPMIRSFPLGFNYPIPKGWPRKIFNVDYWWLYHWHEPEDKVPWRSFCIVTRELADARNNHHITEFSVDVNHAWTGLNPKIFAHTSQEYEDLKSIYSRKGFSRIDLAFAVADMEVTGWRGYRSGLLKSALECAVGLEHFSFHAHHEFQDESAEHLIPLLDIFPIDKWPKLKHISISGLFLTEDDLFNFISKLPPRIKSIEILQVIFWTGQWHNLLLRIRDSLVDWHSRPHPPKLSISFPHFLNMEDAGYSTWIVDEIDAFLYHNGPHPIDEQFPRSVPNGVGILRQDFDPSYDRPNLDNLALMDLGFIRESRNTEWWISRGEGPGAWFRENGGEPRFGDDY